MEHSEEQDVEEKLKAPLQVPVVEVPDTAPGEDEKPDAAIDGELRGKLDHFKACWDAVDQLVGPAEEEEVEEDTDEESNWSLLEEIVNASDDDGPTHDGENDSCTFDEAVAYRKRLRLVGEDRFIAETVECGSVSAKKLITAFGIRHPHFLDGQPDQAYHGLLGLAICRELSRREKLPQFNTIEDAAQLLLKSQDIIVLTGAGISTSLGIPDFRSKETGLYARLEHLGLSDPQEVFDIEVFREDPSIFYSVAKDILPSSTRFSPTHAFIRLLQDQGKLLTNYTQNIDNLEQAAGISKDKLIQCHGSFASATCIKCQHRVSGETVYSDLKAGEVAECRACLDRINTEKDHKLGANSLSHSSQNFANKKRKRRTTSDTSFGSPSAENITHKRSNGDDFNGDDDDDDKADDIPTAGVMKPDITFFGEALPSTFHDRLISHDRDKVDLVIVLGTSLKVAPVSEVVGVLPADIPQIYISREPVSHVNFDVELLGECDVVVQELCRRAGWELKHEMVQPQVLEGLQILNVEGWEGRWRVGKDIKADENDMEETDDHDADDEDENEIANDDDEKGQL